MLKYFIIFFAITKISQSQDLDFSENLSEGTKETFDSIFINNDIDIINFFENVVDTICNNYDEYKLFTYKGIIIENDSRFNIRNKHRLEYAREKINYIKQNQYYLNRIRMTEISSWGGSREKSTYYPFIYVDYQIKFKNFWKPIFYEDYESWIELVFTIRENKIIFGGVSPPFFHQ